MKSSRYSQDINSLLETFAKKLGEKVGGKKLGVWSWTFCGLASLLSWASLFPFTLSLAATLGSGAAALVFAALAIFGAIRNYVIHVKSAEKGRLERMRGNTRGETTSIPKNASGAV